MTDNSNSFGSYLAGFIVGGLVGAAVALMMAPQSGEETRGMIRDKSIELRDRASDSMEDARLRAEKAIDDARMRVDELSQQLRARGGDAAEAEQLAISLDDMDEQVLGS